jgi:hypothetical protein
MTRHRSILTALLIGLGVASCGMPPTGAQGPFSAAAAPDVSRATQPVSEISYMAPRLEEAKQSAGNVVSAAGEIAKETVEAAKGTVQQTAEKAGQVAEGAAEAAKAKAKEVADVATSIGGVTGGILGGALGSLLGPMGTLTGAGIGAWYGRAIEKRVSDKAAPIQLDTKGPMK